MTWVAVAVGTASAVTAIGTGIAQRRKSRKMAREAKRLEAEQRQAALTKSNLSRYLASRRMPGYDVAAQNISQAGSNAYQALTASTGSAADVISGLNKIQGSQNEALQGLALNAANRYDQRFDIYGQDLGMLADRKREDWQNKVQAIAALYSGGIQNIRTGLSDVSNTIYNYKAEQDWSNYQKGNPNADFAAWWNYNKRKNGQFAPDASIDPNSV